MNELLSLVLLISGACMVAVIISMISEHNRNGEKRRDTLNSYDDGEDYEGYDD